MDRDNVLFNVKKDFYQLVLGFYNNYIENKSSFNLEVYKRNLDLYNKINSCNNFNDLSYCLKEILNEISLFRNFYFEKVEKYSSISNKNSSEARVIFSEIKYIANIAQLLTDMYSNIRIEMSKVTKKGKKTVENVKPDGVVKPVENEPVVNKINNSEIDYSDETIIKLEELNKKILSFKEKIVTLDVNSEETVQLRVQLNLLLTEREHIVHNIFGFEGVNYLKNIESLESRYVSSSRNDFKPFSISHDDYLSRLDDLLHIISDLKFNGINSKYINTTENMTVNQKFNVYKQTYSKYMSQYMNLVGSLYENNNPVIYENGDYSITSIDLLSYLSIYNLNGGYQDFKSHHKTGKIGNEAISKEMYSEAMNNISLFMNSFRKKSSELFKTKGSKIIIRDVSDNKNNIKKDLDEKILNLYKMIIEKSQDNSQSM